MAVAGLYRRLLPSPPATEFSSPEGPWHWIDESMLECCESLEKVKAEGMTFAKVACAGACAGASVQAIRSNKSCLHDFRQHVLDSCSSEDKHMIVSYDRQILKQTGSGHFSPIGGYHKGRDLTLILDVARFKYPPYWVPLALLWDAVNSIDPTTTNWRGIVIRILYCIRLLGQDFELDVLQCPDLALLHDRFLLATKPERPPSVLFTLSCKDELWRPISKYLIEEVPNLLSSADLKSTQDVVSIIIGLLPGDVASFVKWIAEVRRADTAPANAASEADLALKAKVRILEELRKTVLYSIVSNWAKVACVGCELPSIGKEDLSKSLESACCHGVAALSGMLSSSSLRCTKASTKRLNGGTETSVVIGDVCNVDRVENNIDIIVPTSPVRGTEANCTSLHPNSADMLTMLLFALPPNVWITVRNKDVQSELLDAASVTNFPTNFQVVVSNLREQLSLVHRWSTGNIEDDFNQPGSLE